MAYILVVDVDAAARRRAAGELEAEGHRVVEVADGELVLGAAVEYRVDAIILDLVMPGARIDGFGALHALGAYPTTRDVPVLVVTDKPSPQNRSRARAMGAKDFVIKPAAVGDIARRVQMALIASERRPEVERAAEERLPQTVAPAVQPTPAPAPARMVSKIVTVRNRSGRVVRRVVKRVRQRPAAVTAAVAAAAPVAAAAGVARALPLRTNETRIAVGDAVALLDPSADGIAAPEGGKFAVQVESTVGSSTPPRAAANVISSLPLRPIEDPTWEIRFDTFDSERAAEQMAGAVYEKQFAVEGSSNEAVRYALIAEWELPDSDQARQFESNRQMLFDEHRKHLSGLVTEWLYRSTEDKLKYTTLALYADEDSWLEARAEARSSKDFSADAVLDRYGARELYGTCPCRVEMAA